MKTFFIFLAMGWLVLRATPAVAAGGLPGVVILATGGTIAGKAASAMQLTGYKPGELTAGELIAAAPGISDFARISAEQIANIGSPNITVEIWLKLAARINELLASTDVAGIVVTHGTDTIEETGYFLNLVVKSDKPVVLVGAMRPATAVSADGPLNLIQAVAVASSPDARGRGVLVVLNGEINGARDVTKTSATQVETFRSHDFGFLGYVVNNRPEFHRQSTRRHTVSSEFDISGLTNLPLVDILYGYVDPSMRALEAVLESGLAGLIIAGTGNGSLTAQYRARLAEASKKGLAVMRGSRTGSGVVTYDPRDDEPGFMFSGSLNPQKARILLMLALTKTRDRAEIQRIFSEY